MKSNFKSYDELPLMLTAADISGILGHASIQITLDLYCHASIEMKRDAVNRMSDLW